MAWLQGAEDAARLGPYRPAGGPPVPYGAYGNYLVPIGAVHEGTPADGPASSSFGLLGALGSRGAHDLSTGPRILASLNTDAATFAVDDGAAPHRSHPEQVGYHRDATSTLSQTPGAGNPTAEATPSQIQGVLNPGGGLARQAAGVAKDGKVVRQRKRPAGSPVLMGRSSRSYPDGTVNPGNAKNPDGTIPDHSEFDAWSERTWVRAEGALQLVPAGVFACGAVTTFKCPPLSRFLLAHAADNAISAYEKMSTGHPSDSILKTMVRETVFKPLGCTDWESGEFAGSADGMINLWAAIYAGALGSRSAAAESSV